MKNHNSNYVTTYFSMKAPEVNLINAKTSVVDKTKKKGTQVK